jgi:hypothetical protein
MSCLWYGGFITSDPLSKFNVIQFRPLFSRLGHTLSFTWGSYAAFRGRTLLCHIEGFMMKRMNTSSDVSKFKISQFFLLFNCCILPKAVLGGVDGNLHIPVPSRNRLNQTEPATFAIMPCWAFSRDSDFLYFKKILSVSAVRIRIPFHFIYCPISVIRAVWRL